MVLTGIMVATDMELMVTEPTDITEVVIVEEELRD